MKVYIACASRSWQRARRVSDSLRRLGIEVVGDWTQQVEADRAAGRTDDDLTSVERVTIRQACLAGVRAATLVLWLAEPSDGASYEVGYADAKGKPIIVSGAHPHPIYGITADAWLRTDAKAIEVIVGMARQRGADRMRTAVGPSA